MSNRHVLTSFYVNVLYNNLGETFLRGVPGQRYTEPAITKIPQFVTMCTEVTEGDIHYSMTRESSDRFRGTVYDLDKYVLCEWEDAMVKEEIGAVSHGDQTWWKVVVNANAMLLQGIPLDRLVECLACARVSEKHVIEQSSYQLHTLYSFLLILALTTAMPLAFLAKKESLVS